MLPHRLIPVVAVLRPSDDDGYISELFTCLIMIEGLAVQSSDFHPEFEHNRQTVQSTGLQAALKHIL